MQSSLFRHFARLIDAGEFNYSYNISLVRNYLYIENAKAACTTIKSSLGSAELLEAGFGRGFSDAFLRNVHTNILGTPFVKPFQMGERLFDAFAASNDTVVFTFVKNPYTRLLSAYLDKVKRKLPESGAIFAAAGKTFADEISFANCIRALRKEMDNGKKIDKHFRSQFLQCGQGEVELDFIGHVETFDVDFRTLCEKIGLPNAKVIVVNSHSTGALSVMKDYYSDALASEVFDLYRADFEAFGYDADWRKCK